MTDSEDPTRKPPHDVTPEEAPTIATGARPAGAPARIGRYTVRRVIASGGMGTVLEATQDEPRRSVAIKIMKGGLDSPEAMRRFQFEAQLLARLRHPGIAQIYEAGTHDDGSGPMPFFAMEYIPNAKPITDYAEGRKLDLRAKLELFARVCDAIHHGHQRGIIHRDIKPGNILVDSEGNPRIIDFGVARATDSDNVLTSYQTQVGQLVGSIAYMSPEQFEADPHDLDTRSDVYTLGVVLYQLITGRLPYEVSSAKIYDAARIVREQEPARFSSIGVSTPPEVETIVRKALAKDREQRYQSAHGLAQDLHRFLSGQTVVASPPSAVYQMRVFARRHKALLAGVATAFVVLVGAVIATSTMYLRAERMRVEAERASARSQAAVDYLTDALSTLEPDQFDHEPTVADLLTHLNTSIEGAFPNDPLIEAELRQTIGWANVMKFDWPTMEKHLSRAVELRVAAGAENDPKMIEALNSLALVYDVTGENDKRVDVLKRKFELQTHLNGENDEGTLQAGFTLAEAMCAASRLKEAHEVAEQTFTRRREVLGPDHEETLRSQAQIGWLMIAQGRRLEAEEQNAALLETCRRTLGERHRLTRTAKSQLAAALVAQGRLVDAEKLYGGRTLPASYGVERRYQGDPDIGGDTQLLVFWETWCPFSQRTVPRLEQAHLRYENLEVLGLTMARPPSDDEKVEAFIRDKGLTFAVAKSNRTPWAYFDVPGTPWIVLAKDGRMVWENSMDTPEDLLDGILEGVLAAKAN